MLFVLGLISALPAQKPEQVKQARQALDDWLTLDVRDRDEHRLKRLLPKLLRAGEPLVQDLGARLQRARRAEDTGPYRALTSVCSHLGLAWLGRVKDSEMVYAGQYEVLRPLMPEVGEFYLGLLTDTPQWFPITRRHEVVAPLRDLYPKGPGPVALDRIETIALDVQIEPRHLREQLGLALAQWGNRKLVKDRLRELEREARSKDSEEALIALRKLAYTNYGIRDYAVAAVNFQDLVDKAEREDYRRVPTDYYNGACCMALSGNLRGGMKLLERCLAYNFSDAFDSSLRLKRELFEKDPEIRALRRDPGFTKLLDKAFAKDDEASGERRR